MSFLTTSKRAADKNKGGRPPSLVADAATMKTLKGLGEIQATTRECAAVLSVSHQTFIAFLQREPDAAEALERGKEMGKTSLRRTQFRLAQKNASMAIFLGKNYLDQTDKQDITASVTQDIHVSDARAKLERLIDRQTAAG
ncbi:hypothetical protein [Rhizobium lusitanum]|uniref:hypothetical protein n=1 Tax=Rhizobium lusitanum TaxID=293958 RepID=UPI00195D9F5B|nr:hypothetical protein [Rhizobium lusitanum]MBM7045428.1 hypothetical protein [Rhizobium lusitanum]